MVKYTHSHKSPVEAKILLLLGMCEVKPSEFKYEYWGDNRTLKWGKGKRIQKNIIDYVKMVFVGEHKQALKFAEFCYRDEYNKRIYKYIISPTEKINLELFETYSV